MASYMYSIRLQAESYRFLILLFFPLTVDATYLLWANGKFQLFFSIYQSLGDLV